MKPIVIIGSGLAGYNVARELRKLNKELPLTIISADSGSFYSKPMLSNALASKKAPEAIAMNGAEQMAQQLNAGIRAHTRVTAIAPALHQIKLIDNKNDEVIEYSKLVLALGADQIRLPMAGDANVFTVNDLDDYARFRTAITDKQRITIIGAGLIGCEFANDLAANGYRVDVVDIAGRPLIRHLPPAGAALLQEKLAALGIVWHFNTSVSTLLETQNAGIAVQCNDGTRWNADVVLSAVGLKPRTQLAQNAGIAINRGIVVNRLLETSAPDVYALGDCAEVEGLVLPYVMPLTNAARALAATLAGTPTPVSYPAMPVGVKTPACPTVVAPPAANAVGAWQITATPDSVKSLFVGADGKLLGFALNGSATSERMALTAQLPPTLN